MLDSAGSNPATIANLIIHTVIEYEETKLNFYGHNNTRKEKKAKK